ncbi:MAG: N-formylglutamate amidohydrolase [Gammaproteobacteria bacterium]|jgi:predicted N-formylglutamate amidohydrolase|nr:N-formylglutamate amidohydrolase [Gammaproteobacteria bacterium]MDP7296569.1 N-formylglutamate amidohydrolase [Gammaproteobacteria bacterium]MDP7419604.1 N-formylglutamate amidohydrolase [Gammaproteobacteria bacterium]MDP7660585.1 N-formylglutamate amidohydrolase [Gammaproteobacteria bacterium]HJP39750.1 N-formylglutamate amidohydrolase [Gammaproteobacteria bacterium]
MTGKKKLIGADEPGPVEVLHADSAYPVLLVCDHATNRIPASLDGLGISPVDLETHFAVDIGAADIVRHISRKLKLPAVLTTYSRLVVDCNRILSDPSAFPLYLEHMLVPSNHELDHDGRKDRADTLYWPYHKAIRDCLTDLETVDGVPALVAIHSFTPALGDNIRPWHLGVLWDKDPRIPLPLLSALRKLDGIIVGDNEPYSGKHQHDFTVDHHAEAEGLAHVSVEIRQDLIETPQGVQYWGDLLATALVPILSAPGLYEHWAV